ncbi:MAG: prepilin-type N-terminal cleavage/methylation domain-containing protein [Phycisphaerae bacterium]|nr:prepilin-type N-terminal cleavage/methylation domain-containing protein [Phycisphaerae bacterium]
MADSRRWSCPMRHHPSTIRKAIPLDVDPRHQSAIRNLPSEIPGFTLIEILLVVAIITMVAGLGGGYCVGTYKRLVVEKTARQLLLMATYARIMAIEQQRPYELQLDAGNRGFLLATTEVNKQTGETQRTIVKDYYCRPVEFEGDVKFEDVVLSTMMGESPQGAEEEQKVIFLPNGSAESAILQIGDGKSHYTVAVVAATGKATLSLGTAKEIDTVSIDLDVQ